MSITKGKHSDAFKREWKEEEYILEVKKMKVKVKWLNEKSFPILDSTFVPSKPICLFWNRPQTPLLPQVVLTICKISAFGQLF